MFYGKENKLNDQLNTLYKDFTKRIFPFMNEVSPRFRKAGEIEDYGWPVYDDNSNIIERKDDLTENPIDFINKNVKGRGIVISVSTRHSKDVSRLIKVLRALNNKLQFKFFIKMILARKQ